MGKSNKNKNAQSERGSKTAIEEPKFDVKSDSQVLSAGDKKFLAQKERERKEQEDLEKLKEKQEAEKKKKNKASSGKTTTKQGPPKNEEKPVLETSKSKTRRYENAGDGASYQGTRNPGNVRHESKETPQNNTWSQEDTSSNATKSGDSWNWKGNVHQSSTQKKREANSNYKKNANDQNYFDARSSYSYTCNDGKNDKEFIRFLNSKNFNGKVREIKGDLFDAPSDYSLAHCVAEDFSMGAGIAKEFRFRFKRVSQLLDQNAETGGLAILENKNRFIYYLVTKALSRGKPTLYTLWKSLLKLRDHTTEHKVTKLAIPQIGCGLDRLDWSEVKRMLEYIFRENEINIDVYILDLNPEDTPNPTKAPRKYYVKHVVQPLTDIQSQTGLVFFGSEDGATSFEIECLAKKYNFINEYKLKKKSTGDVIKFVDRNEYLYGLIIRRTQNNQIVFTEFEKCLFALRKMLKTDETVYIGLQGFVEKGDEVITEKLVNLMQNTLLDVEIWVCWPDTLKHLCPQPKQY